jgi:hypothetical protein
MMNRLVVRNFTSRTLVGPPDPDSNLCTIKLKPARNKAELKLQSLQLKVHDFNHNFWKEHNQQFQKAKSLYISQKLSESDMTRDKLTVDELSDFYKKFLNENYVNHKNYLKEWSILNFRLTWEMLKYNVINILRRN